MKKITLISSLILLMISVNPTFAGEVTDMEFNFLGISITYYDPNAAYIDRIACTVFNSNNKAIGGGTALVSAGIATVLVSLPQKYQDKKLTAKCKNEG